MHFVLVVFLPASLLLSVQARPKMCHKLSLWCIRKLLVKGVESKTSEHLTFVSHTGTHTGHAGLRLKRKAKKRKTYCCPLQNAQHTHASNLCITLLSYLLFSRYAWGLSLNASCDMCREETAVVWLLQKPGESVCPGDDITHSMTSMWQRGVRGRAQMPRFCVKIDRLQATKDLWGKTYKGKPCCS